MSHYPNNTNPYGDRWETNDGAWTDDKSGASIPPSDNRPPNYSQPINPSSQFNQSGNHLTNQTSDPRFSGSWNLPASPTQPAAEIPITPDDILFMRKVRTDCFFYRVVPITTMGYAAYMMYNKTMNVPLSFGKFLAVGLTTLVVSIGSYRGKFTEAVRDSPLDTPYLRALRARLNLGQDARGSEFATGFGDSSTDLVDSRSFTENKYLQTASSNVTTAFDPGFSNQQNDLGNQENGQPNLSTSYDELRARNRGYIK